MEWADDWYFKACAIWEIIYFLTTVWGDEKLDLYVDPINCLESVVPKPQAHLRRGINIASFSRQCQQGPRRWVPQGGGKEKGECAVKGNLLPGEDSSISGAGSPVGVRVFMFWQWLGNPHHNIMHKYHDVSYPLVNYSTQAENRRAKAFLGLSRGSSANSGTAFSDLFPSAVKQESLTACLLPLRAPSSHPAPDWANVHMSPGGSGDRPGALPLPYLLSL